LARSSRLNVMRLGALWATLLIGSSLWAFAGEESVKSLPNEGRYLYRPVPDIPLRDVEGRPLWLSSLWKERPVLLTLIFTRCSGICSPLLRSLKSAVEVVGGLGSDYHIVVLSFDPRDTLSDMRELADHLELSGKRGWIFAVAAPEDIARVVKATGFWFVREESSQQYDHPAMVIGIREGRLLRFLVGGTVAPVRLNEVVRELRGEFVPAYPLPRPGKVIFRCAQYDPESGRWRPDWGFLLLLLPGVLTLFGTVWIFHRGRFFRDEGGPGEGNTRVS